MDVSAVKNFIQKKSIPDFMIFTGEEWKVQRLYIEKIAAVKNLKMNYIDSITDIYRSLKSKSLIDDTCLYIVRDDKEIIQNEKIQAQIKDGLLGDNVLILLLTSVDKRTKFYKQYKDTIVEFNPLKSEILKKYIQQEIELSDKSCERLMEICENDYGRILLEIDKIKRYVWEIEDTQKGKSRFDLAFEQLLKDGTIYEPPKDAIFEFVDAVLKRHNTKKVFALYQECKASGEAVMVMLSVLFNGAKHVLQIQTCNGSDIAKSTGLTGFQIMKAKEHMNAYTNRELENMLYIIQKCERGIKTGRIDEHFVMDYVLVKIL